MKPKIVIYGSYGYTGKLIVQLAKEKGVEVLLAGRREDKLKTQSKETGFRFEACNIDDVNGLQKLLKDATVVLHCAGPFQFTSKEMTTACFSTSTHYLDITGEIPVFEMCSQLDVRAKAANIMLMPGTGFDVVPSDCLAAHLKTRLPDATHLELAFAGLGGGVSQGTAKTIVEGLGLGGAIRKDGKITIVPNAHSAKEIDFGEKQLWAAAIPWGDVSTAFYSTRIPNITVYTGLSPKQIKQMKRSNYLGWLLRQRWLKNFLKKKIEQQPAGPTYESRVNSKTLLWGKVKNASNEERISLLQTPDGYSLTAITALECAKRVCEENFKVGFQTPSLAYGKDFILNFEKCERQDL